jgi:NADPH:quinone reductase-like Zn-dependent oxidoreductase
VAARFTGPGPKGALCEYAVADTKIADKVPENLSSDGAAALASASFAIPLTGFIRVGDKRVLVLRARVVDLEAISVS